MFQSSVSLDQILQLIASLRHGETIKRGIPLWTELTEWLKKICQKDSTFSLTAYLKATVANILAGRYVFEANIGLTVNL